MAGAMTGNRRQSCKWQTCDRYAPGAPEMCDAHAWRARNGADMDKPVKRLSRSRSLRDRLYERIDRADSGCWLYTGHTRANAGRRGLVVGTYGRMSNGEGGTEYAHRVSYRLHKGAIPAGAEVRHVCDTPNCVNPEHLTVGSRLDNVRDMMSRGRHGERRPAL